MTTHGAIDVDAVVRAVLAELGRRAGSGGDGYVFAGRLLGQTQVEALDGAVKEVRVVTGTVVTPLAADLMKRRGISLRVVAGGKTSKGTGEWAVAIEGPRSGEAEAIRRALLDGWAEVAANDAAPWVAASRDRGALFLTPEASIAVWRANRVDGVRAASACDVAAVTRAVRHLGLNLLVIEPSAHSIPTVKAMAETFRQGGAPRMPEGLR